MSTTARARALADHTASRRGELSFGKNDVLLVDLGGDAPEGFLNVTNPETGAEGVVPMMGSLAIEGPQTTVGIVPLSHHQPARIPSTRVPTPRAAPPLTVHLCADARRLHRRERG